jgi:hypothetical protein
MLVAMVTRPRDGDVAAGERKIEEVEFAGVVDPRPGSRGIDAKRERSLATLCGVPGAHRLRAGCGSEISEAVEYSRVDVPSPTGAGSCGVAPPACTPLPPTEEKQPTLLFPHCQRNTGCALSLRYANGTANNPNNRAAE